jgi:hypothetical protein
VRVTDGTDVAASIVVLTNCITFTAKYSGTLGNQLQVSVAAGSQASTQKVTVALPGYVPEVFDNIGAGLSGNALWVAIASAINNGLSAVRGASALIVASAGVGTTAPAVASYTPPAAPTAPHHHRLGADRPGHGPAQGHVRPAQHRRQRRVPGRLRRQHHLGRAGRVRPVRRRLHAGHRPAGDTIANAVTVKGTAGVDSYAFKLLLGDWVYFNDTINGLVRLISPQGFAAGRIVVLSPEQGTLNKPIYGIVGTQKSLNNQVYSGAELQTLAQAGIDVITNPVPGGQYFGLRFGHNSSSNFAIHGDNYTRMTNFLAYTFNASMGLFVGRLQSAQANDPTRREAKNTTDNFLQTLVDQRMLDSFQTQCDLGNNSPTRIGAGYMQLDVKARYLSVVEYFIVNLEGGQTVTINRANTAPAT